MKRDKTRWIQDILRRYKRLLCQYAFRLTGNFEHARDAVQDTFLRLWNEEALADDRLTPWLFRVCRNRCIDMLRKDKPMQPLADLQAAVLPDPEGYRREFIELLRNAAVLAP